MEIYQLRTFVTVAQQGHLTQAAELLHLSQPAVTAQIKALEEDVGMPLFERSTGGVSLTRAGQEMLPQAHAILAASRELINRAKELKGQLSGRAIIGTITTPEMIHIGPWVAALIAKYPLLDIHIRHNVTGVVLNQVRKKEIDAGFFIGKNPYVNVHAVKLAEQCFRVVAPIAWKDRLESGGAKEIGRLPWIGLSQLSSFQKMTAELWRELNIAPKKITDVDHVPIIASLVQSGVGLGIMREDDAISLAEAGKVYLVPDVVKRTDLQFIYPADRVGDPILGALLEELAVEWNIPFIDDRADVLVTD